MVFGKWPVAAAAVVAAAVVAVVAVVVVVAVVEVAAKWVAVLFGEGCYSTPFNNE